MPITALGVVKDGVIVPNMSLPEGTHVQIVVPDPMPGTRLTAGELRRLPRAQRQEILAAAAAAAEEDYRTDKDLTGFDAFSEEELDDDESDAR